MASQLDDPRIIEFDVRTDEMLVNMGPQHPSTHGVLRLVLRTDGEIVSEVEPHIGYLHRCAEKIGENLTPRQWIPYTDRMDYLAGMNMNLGWSLCVEKLLDHTIPESGMDRKEYLRKKFGSDEQAAQVYDPVRAAGKDENIPFEFDKITISPNTLNAHRIIRWAMAEGFQNAVVERLFQLYFVEGANLTDKAVLADAAVEAGLERAVVERLLESEADVAETKAEISQAQQMGVTGVPAFIIGNRYAVMGAREPEAIAQAISEVVKERSAPAGNA